MIPTVKGFGIVNKAEIDVFFLEFSCFFDDPADVGNLISGSSAFSKTSLNIWKFTVLKWHLSYYVSARPDEGLDSSHLFSLLQTLLSSSTSYFLHQMCILQGTTWMLLADDLPTHTPMFLTVPVPISALLTLYYKYCLTVYVPLLHWNHCEGRIWAPLDHNCYL